MAGNTCQHVGNQRRPTPKSLAAPTNQLANPTIARAHHQATCVPRVPRVCVWALHGAGTSTSQARHTHVASKFTSCAPAFMENQASGCFEDGAACDSFFGVGDKLVHGDADAVGRARSVFCDIFELRVASQYRVCMHAHAHTQPIGHGCSCMAVKHGWI